MDKYRCHFCLEQTGNFQGNFMPPGTACSLECEQNYMSKFIIPWAHSKHRARALWFKHLGLKTMNNIGRIPACTEHFNYKVCLGDSISVNGLQSWINNPDNSYKARKKRQRDNCKPITTQDMVTGMLQQAAGSACAGKDCFRNLWKSWHKTLQWLRSTHSNLSVNLST